MVIKRILGRRNKKYRTCLRCGQQIEKELKDNTVYTCSVCGQQHYVDICDKCLALTVAERPEIREYTKDVKHKNRKRSTKTAP